MTCSATYHGKRTVVALPSTDSADRAAGLAGAGSVARLAIAWRTCTLAYFREHSAKLVPPVAKDVYEDEAYRLLELKRGKRDLFDE